MLFLNNDLGIYYQRNKKMLKLVKIIKICEFIQTTEFVVCIHVRTTFPLPYVCFYKKKRKRNAIFFIFFHLTFHFIKTLHM